MVNTTSSTILVCISEKEHSKIALKYACSRAKYTKSNVLMLYVVDPVDYNALFSVADVIKEERFADAEKLLAEYQEEAKKWSKIIPSYEIKEGFIKDEIINTISANSDISLLVLGVAMDGSSNKSKLLTNLTQEIGDSYHIPLLLLPGNLTDQQIQELNR